MRPGKVLIVGAEENPSLPILESLSLRGMQVHVASHKAMCAGFFSKYAHKRFRYTSPYEEEEKFLQELLDYIKAEKFEITFVLGDGPTDLLAKNKKLFDKYTTIPLVDLETYIQCRDKTKTMKAAERIGVATPHTYYPDEESIEHIAGRVAYPVVLKPNMSDGARGISFPRNKEELLRTYPETVSLFGSCHVQEYIPQTGAQYKAELLLDKWSEVKAWCVYKKIRYYPVNGGSSTLNVTVERRDILESAAKILKELRWSGMGDCDFIEDPRDGIPKLMEINPRFTRSIKICVLAGIDFPYLLYRVTCGEDVKPVCDYQAGVYLRYFSADVMWFLRSPNRLRAKPSFFWLFGKKLRDEIFSIKDPGPGIGYCLGKFASRFNRRERFYHFR